MRNIELSQETKKAVTHEILSARRRLQQSHDTYLKFVGEGKDGHTRGAVREIAISQDRLDGMMVIAGILGLRAYVEAAIKREFVK
jgi:hypothetical protein